MNKRAAVLVFWAMVATVGATVKGCGVVVVVISVSVFEDVVDVGVGDLSDGVVKDEGDGPGDDEVEVSLVMEGLVVSVVERTEFCWLAPVSADDDGDGVDDGGSGVDAFEVVEVREGTIDFASASSSLSLSVI